MPTVDINVEQSTKWQARLKNITQQAKAEVKVGFLGGDSYPDGTSVAYVASINEYGKGHNPERPFVRETVKDYMPRWAQIIEQAIKGGMSPENILRAYEMAGQDAEGLLREQIKTWPRNNPPNAFATVWAKDRRSQTGRGTVANDPEAVLVDTGIMINAIRHEVTRG